MRVDISKKKARINIWFLILQMKIKKYNNVWNGIRDKIKEISSGDEKNYAIMKKIHKS